MNKKICKKPAKKEKKLQAERLEEKIAPAGIPIGPRRR